MSWSRRIRRKRGEEHDDDEKDGHGDEEAMVHLEAPSLALAPAVI